MENVQVRVVNQTLSPNITRLEAQSVLRPPATLTSDDNVFGKQAAFI